MIMRTCTFVLALLIAGRASAQSSSWTSTDVGAVAIAGSAAEANGVWTVNGAGSDIWGTADSFQFLHQPIGASGSAVARVSDLQNTNPFAKAGLMLRASLDASAATAILDVKPDGGIELMNRVQTGAAMEFVAGGAVTLPTWLRLDWTGGSINAWASQDGISWTFIHSAQMAVSAPIQVGVAVTSHDSLRLNTTHVDSLQVAAPQPIWISSDIGAVGLAGNAHEDDGTWSVTGAGGDIWGTSDGFHFLHQQATTLEFEPVLFVRVDAVQNTDPFAKAGLMLRQTIDADSDAVILDVKPDGGVEFMRRQTKGGPMEFIAGSAVQLPAWLRLGWNADGSQFVNVGADVSQDGIHWTPVGNTSLIVPTFAFEAGVAVTSHDTGLLNTARFSGLSLQYATDFAEIGSTGLVGSVAIAQDCCGGTRDTVTIEGAGSDIWGATDSFVFYPRSGSDASAAAFYPRLVGFSADHPFAKAGVMWRDGLGAGAATVVLDVKPDGGVEFMARTCAGCDMRFIAAASTTLPAFLDLRRDATTSTFTAAVVSGNGQTRTDLGSIAIPMMQPMGGNAVTSHDPDHIATALFDRAQ
jgi:hypothetical protein